MSRREQILASLMVVLLAGLIATVRRNEALPEKVPDAGLIILRDGDPGEPDVTLNPRTAFYSHRVELELFVTQPTPAVARHCSTRWWPRWGELSHRTRRSAASPRTSSSQHPRPGCWRSRAPRRS